MYNISTKVIAFKKYNSTRKFFGNTLPISCVSLAGERRLKCVELNLHMMAKCYKDFCFILFVIQMLISFSSSTYDISRGDIDHFSRDLVEKIPRNIKCGSDVQYCSCDSSETFTYGYEEQGKATVKCAKNSNLPLLSNCAPFSAFKSIQIVNTHAHAVSPLAFSFRAFGTCEWKSTEFTVLGGFNTDWSPVKGNPGNILVQPFSIPKMIEINDPAVLLSTFPGMLLKLQIECYFGVVVHQTCLLLKIEGQTNITTNPYFPTTSPTTTASPTSSSTSPSTSATSSITSSTSSPTTQKPGMPIISESEGLNTKPSTKTTKVSTSPLSTTAIPSDPQNREREGDDDDSSSLVPILVPIILSFFLVIALVVIFLYRRRQRSTSANIEKDFDEEKKSHISPNSYVVPGSQTNKTPIYDTVYESTNPPQENAPIYYELEDDYATRDKPTPKIPDSNANRTDSTSPQSANIYQDIGSDVVARSTVKSEDNLGCTDESTEDPYYYSLEDGNSNENIYDKVTEEPHSNEHFYSVLEKPN